MHPCQFRYIYSSCVFHNKIKLMSDFHQNDRITIFICRQFLDYPTNDPFLMTQNCLILQFFQQLNNL